MAREPPMKSGGSMQSKIDAYIAHRRQGGYALSREATQLANFARFADKIRHRGPLTLELASRWALASQHGRPITAARRIEVLRGFARYYQQFEPATVIPPLRLFGPGHRRLTPHIYTDSEIDGLLLAAAKLRPSGGLRAASCRAIFGLLAATGLRISEATGLKRSDVDLNQGVLLIRHAKFGKQRWVHLHPTTTNALRQYVKQRDREPLSATIDAFFAYDRGCPASTRNVQYAFETLRRKLRWRARGNHPSPRIHDLRRTASEPPSSSERTEARTAGLDGE
jgi:integrase